MDDRLPRGEVAAAAAVLVSGLVEYRTQVWLEYSGWRFLFWLVVLGTAVAVALVRRAPWLSLVIVWLIPICQIATGTPFAFTQVAVVVVAFGAARWGGRVTLWASGLSILAGALVVVVLLQVGAVRINLPIASSQLIAGTVRGLGIGWRIGVAVVFVALLGAPWLAGVALRTADRARGEVDRAARERARAEETARVRDAQTRLARDVHDVVGHSLAVILAQAESGQYLPDDDPAALKSALATIATSARTSLREVRDVLSATRDTAGDDLDKLIDNLRSGGHEVVSGQDGTPRPVGEESQAAAYRVLQEMLTNAIRHGRRDRPVIVRRSWADEALVIEVRNAVGAGSEGTGSGLDGMRERLAAVGGALTAGRRDHVFVATARIPLT
ncbi:sensor histidine kinase [Actinoplanes sp. NPDC051513]|uniref:sensor histidine kinase n=1 Tax=Actinoplanes sp. NPDC051513 TaxID=3363908 RepID=UPI003791F9FE